MVVLVITGILALILAYLGQRNALHYGFEFGFAVVTIVAAIHYNFGSDYWAYNDFFYEWNRYYSFRWDYHYLTSIFKDAGWVLLCFICKPIGFFGMVAMLNVLQNYIYYSFIKEYVPRNFWTIAFFLYLFTIDLYLMNMSMMRQGLAVSLFVWAVPMIIKKKILQSVGILLFSASIHISAIALIPFILLGIYPIKNGKIISFILFFTFLLMFIYRDSLGFLLEPLDNFEDISSKLTRSQNAYGRLQSFGLGFVVKSLPFFIGLWYLWKSQNWDEIRSPFVFVATFGYLFIPLSAQVYMLQRMYIYFQALTLATIPLTYECIRYKSIRYTLYMLLIMMTIYEYWSFMNADLYMRTFANYHTIFEVLF